MTNITCVGLTYRKETLTTIIKHYWVGFYHPNLLSTPPLRTATIGRIDLQIRCLPVVIGANQGDDGVGGGLWTCGEMGDGSGTTFRPAEAHDGSVR